MVVHIDLSHIIPAACNTMLFELLVVGLLRDPVTCRVYHRSSQDAFRVEIPNSPGNKTSNALTLCALLPTVVLACSPDAFDLRTTVFLDAPLCGRIGRPEYVEATFVAKWLRGPLYAVSQKWLES
jgi:hypothetical protein